MLVDLEKREILRWILRQHAYRQSSYLPEVSGKLKPNNELIPVRLLQDVFRCGKGARLIHHKRCSKPFDGAGQFRVYRLLLVRSDMQDSVPSDFELLGN